MGAALCPPLLAQAPQTLPPVEVRAEARAHLPPSVKAEEASLNETPGGVVLVQPAKADGSRYTLRDLLDGLPGVTLLDFFGGADQPIISIRGSGIQSHPQTRGVMLLDNGLPLNDADGSFIIGMIEARDARTISIRRGANATSPASDTLGGELDFYNLTGADETGSLSAQYGSFNTALARAAFGRQFDNSDVHLSVSGSRSDGYRDHSDQKRYAFRGNLGLFAADNFENRSWISYTDQKFDIPGPLTRDLVYDDPTSVIRDAMPMVLVTDPYRETRQWRFANRSLLKDGDIEHDLGIYYQNTDDRFVSPTTRKDNTIRTFGAQYKLDGKFNAFDYGLGLFAAHSAMDIRYQYNANNPNPPIRLLPDTSYDATAETFNAQLHAAWRMTERLRLLGQLRWVNTRRDLHQNEKDADQDNRWDWLSPKIGVTWSPLARQTFFANVSTTREAPTFDQLIQFKAPPPPPPSMQMIALEPQHSITYEIGGRGSLMANLEWNLALYFSELKKELIEYSPDGISTYTLNYDGKTRHQGIEFGVSGTLPMAGYGNLLSRASYTYNDFTFRDGAYSGNRIAGIPRHLVGGEILYQKGAWKIGPNLRWAIGDTPVDYDNRAEYGGYAILGAKIRYDAARDLSFFLQGDNLTDKRYVSSVTTPAAALDNGAYYFPGNGISVAGGLTFSF